MTSGGNAEEIFTGGQVVAVAVVIVEDRKLLALRRARWRDAGAGLWEVVSGRVGPGEDPAAAAIRETREETGLEIDIVPRPMDCYAMRRGAQPMVVIVYGAHVVRGNFRRSREHDDHRWVTLDELSALGTPPRLVEAARRAYGELVGTTTGY
ncbi:MAG: NUDIX hydrolase [Myxococcales bacterium]|nr:NUDIX hydrolase [Myxococcales bacterium]